MSAYYSDLIRRPHYVYRAYIDTRLAYVGVTTNPPGRFARHSCKKPWWKSVSAIDIVKYTDRDAAFAAEARAIRDEHPIYNISKPGVVDA